MELRNLAFSLASKIVRKDVLLYLSTLVILFFKKYFIVENFKIYKSKGNSLMRSDVTIRQLRRSSLGQSFFIFRLTHSFNFYIILKQSQK